MKKILFFFIGLFFFASCSFLPEQPEEINLETHQLHDIVYGNWNIQAVSDPFKYGTVEWQNMTNPFPAFTFYASGQYEFLLDGQVIEQRTFAVVDDNGTEALQLGVPEGIRWKVNKVRANTLEIQRETENGTIKQRLRRK